ncbi:hypothetical protein T265_06250 [Opisthorchis viverrini]|uniref:Uncharacterized protein n=1 Tax=Opisthorchis viverrini TaxID=6198 RepID=A0A074ZL66_OPIVI|nr:hypothetical protein T265_06250 [Opisthorchis viverrini]KER26532.1 hypothetical protein T265_06250 [Opisthorchis viverrini]
MSQPTQLLVLDTFFNGSIRCTTGNALSNHLVTDTPTPTHTSYGSEGTIVEHLETFQFRCLNRSSLTVIHTTQQPSLDTHVTSDYGINHSDTIDYYYNDDDDDDDDDRGGGDDGDKSSLSTEAPV